MTTLNYAASVESDDIVLGIVPETDWGVTPTTPTFTRLRTESETLSLVHNTLIPSELRADRQQPMPVTSDVVASGGTTHPFVASNFDLIFESMLYGTFDAGTPNTLINGTRVAAFTIRKELGPTLTDVMEYPGAYPTALTLNMNRGANITMNLTWILAAETVIAAPTGTMGPANTEQIMTPVNNIQALTWGGADQIAALMNFTLGWTKDGAESQYALASRDAVGMLAGKLNASGSTMTAYFRTLDLYNDFINEVENVFSMTLTDSTGTGYRIDWLNAKINDVSANAAGPGQGVMANLSLLAGPAALGTIRMVKQPES